MSCYKMIMAHETNGVGKGSTVEDRTVDLVCRPNYESTDCEPQRLHAVFGDGRVHV